MNDEDKQLDVLTNQRVSFVLGGTNYTARRATLNDIGRINRFRKEKEQAGDDANIELDASLFILCELMKPNFDFTPDELGEKFDLTRYDDLLGAITEINDVLAKLGLKAPQSLALKGQ